MILSSFFYYRRYKSGLFFIVLFIAFLCVKSKKNYAFSCTKYLTFNKKNSILTLLTGGRAS